MSTLELNLETDVVPLPAPSFAPGASLELALRQRRSERNFATDSVPLASLSTLMWAAGGINRPENGHRTAPSARNWQEVSVYAVLAEGAYRYEPATHRLLLLSAMDLRGLTGVQDFVASAPLNLVYVADYARMQECEPAELAFFAGADAGSMAQNVSLYCATAGLGCVVRALIKRGELAAALGLASHERIALAQSIGPAAPRP
jgi:nitroreductase